MEFETIKFYNYSIRSTVMNNVRMYLAADLLNQYNKKNNRNKKLKNYLKNEQTKDLLKNWPTKSVSSNPSLRFSEDNTTNWDINTEPFLLCHTIYK